MGLGATRLRQRRAAKAQLEHLVSNPQQVVAIHYSCESFYDRPDGSSPRITSIAVRNFGSGQTTSFSIHQIAERKGIAPGEITSNYDDLEKTMLQEFYEYVERHKEHKWLHWSMRDINYGFAAIAHRCRVLGGGPVEIHESNLYDLSCMLIDIYGVGYIGHPRLTKLIELNNISDRDFLNGEAESIAFQHGEYVKLHQSTLRKVDVLVNILGRLANGTLKTHAKFHEVYGGYLSAAAEFAQNHWLFTLIVIVLGVVGSIASIVSLFR